MKKLIALLIVFSVFSCREDPTQLKRGDIIPRDKFIGMLTEMHLMDALSGNNEISSFFPSGDSIDTHAYIFKKYDVTPAEFDTTVVMYSRRPDLFIKLYNDVVLRLTYMNDTVNKTEPKFSKE